MSKVVVWSKGVLSLLYKSGLELSRDYGSVHAAALGFYILLSIFPLATLSAVIVTRILGPTSFSANYLQVLSDIIGEQYAYLLQSLVTTSYETGTNNVWTLINILVLIYTSSYVFYQARISLDAMWHLSPKPGVTNSLLATAKTYTVAYILAFLVGVSFLALLYWNTIWNLLSDLVASRFAINISEVEPMLNLISSPLIYTLIFLAAFRYLPQARSRIPDLLPGALLTALLYWAGNYFYSVYLGYSSASTIYGIASSLVLFLFWAFYSAMIFLYGAKFTVLYSFRFGHGIIPDENMTLISSGLS